jgi:hypothetical protein
MGGWKSILREGVCEEGELWEKKDIKLKRVGDRLFMAVVPTAARPPVPVTVTNSLFLSNIPEVSHADSYL